MKQTKAGLAAGGLPPSPAASGPAPKAPIPPHLAPLDRGPGRLSVSGRPSSARRLAPPGPEPAPLSQKKRAQKMKRLSMLLPLLRPALEPQEEPDSSFPKKIREAERSLVRIRLEDPPSPRSGNGAGQKTRPEGKLSALCSEGTGFFTDETTVVTNFHVIFDMTKRRNIRILTASGRQLAFLRIKHLDALNDLAVLEIAAPAPKEPRRPKALGLAGQSDFFFRDEAYILGFLWGRRRKVRAGRIKDDGFNYFCLANFSGEMRGGSGGPFLNREGKVMGVFHMASGNMCYGRQVKFLRRLLCQPPLPYTKKPKALIWREMARLESLAENGGGMERAEARFRMALALLESGKKNRRKIIRWLRPAAAYGHLRAQFCLGFMLFERRASHEEAGQWISKAACQGLPPAQFCYGLSLLQSKSESPEKALRWIQEAAEQGYSEACHRLGVMLLRGEGARENYGESLKWLQTAAKRGHAEAQQLLSLDIELC